MFKYKLKHVDHSPVTQSYYVVAQYIFHDEYRMLCIL